MAIMQLKLQKKKWGWPPIEWRGWTVMMDHFMIQEGEMLPRGYGLAWRCWDRDMVVVMLVPLNIVVGLVRRLWHALQRGVMPSATEIIRAESYERGRLFGSNSRNREWQRQEPRIREEARQEGYLEGSEAVLTALAKELD